MTQPLVSCLMVTRERIKLARRAIECFDRQTWGNKELVIVDDGTVDYEPMLKDFRGRNTIHYHRIAPRKDVLLGGLRNTSLDLAKGDYWMQWDDDEWYDPARIEVQMRAIQENNWAGCVLRYTLMHLDDPAHLEHPYRTRLLFGTPGTICHKRSTVRYPNMRAGEDTVFLRRLRRTGRIGVLGREESHLFIRCFHGKNTWERAHFTERLRKSPINLAYYLWATHMRHDLHAHPLFQLTDAEQRATRDFLHASRALGVFASE